MNNLPMTKQRAVDADWKQEALKLTSSLDPTVWHTFYYTALSLNKSILLYENNIIFNDNNLNLTMAFFVVTISNK